MEKGKLGLTEGKQLLVQQRLDAVDGNAGVCFDIGLSFISWTSTEWMSKSDQESKFFIAQSRFCLSPIEESIVNRRFFQPVPRRFFPLIHSFAHTNDPRRSIGLESFLGDYRVLDPSSFLVVLCPYQSN